jgi:hypothetical protein
MSRNKAQIRELVKTAFVNDPGNIALYSLVAGQTFDEQFSTASLEMITIENYVNSLFEHEQIVSANAANSRPQNLPNFIETILNFHDGLPLVWLEGQFQYDLSAVDNPDTLKLVSRCAVLESEDGELVVKVAHDNNGSLEPLADDQATRLVFYLKQMKVPGVKIRLINQEADSLKTTLNVYVDPLQIDLITGKQLNTTETIYPVKVAIAEYLRALEFNGAFVTNFFTKAIEDKAGINLCEVELIQWKYADFDFEAVTGWKVAQAGHFKIEDADLTINYLPYALVNN